MLKALIFISILGSCLINSQVLQTPTPSSSQDYYQSLFRNFIIQSNRQKITTSNQQNQGFVLETNKFAQYTTIEFQAMLLVTKVPNDAQVVNPFSVNIASTYGTVNSDDYVDINWFIAGSVSSVKNQGGCGSCWAFSAVSDLQSSYMLNGSPNSLDLSEQQLVDCSGSFYNGGCTGGWMTNAFAYIYKNSLTTQAAYPYIGKAQTCQKTGGSFTIKNLRSYWQNKNCQLLVDILKSRPLTVAVAADSFYWGFYRSGILTQCGTSINHGVALIGVKKSATQNYWIVKNSWGTDWGQSGYIRIDRSQSGGNLCDICSYPQHSIL